MLLFVSEFLNIFDITITEACTINKADGCVILDHDQDFSHLCDMQNDGGGTFVFCRSIATGI